MDVAKASQGLLYGVNDLSTVVLSQRQRLMVWHCGCLWQERAEKIGTASSHRHENSGTRDGERGRVRASEASAYSPLQTKSREP